MEKYCVGAELFDAIFNCERAGWRWIRSGLVPMLQEQLEPMRNTK